MQRLPEMSRHRGEHQIKQKSGNKRSPEERLRNIFEIIPKLRKKRARRVFLRRNDQKISKRQYSKEEETIRKTRRKLDLSLGKKDARLSLNSLRT